MMEELRGSVGFMLLKDDTPDCLGAIELWNTAVERFSGRPPMYTKPADAPYADAVNHSFVALYNPNIDAVVECRVAKCEREPVKGKGRRRRSGADDESRTTLAEASAAEIDEARGDTECQEKTGFALVCLTSPRVFNAGKPPFT